MNAARTIRWGIMAMAMVALCALVAVPSSAAYESSLVRYWALEESSGTTAIDATANGNGTIQGGAVRTSDGKFGRALDFDGNASYIESWSSSLGQTANGTISLWAKADAFADFNCLAMKSRTDGTASVDLGFWNLGTVAFAYFDASGNWHSTGGGEIKTGQWYNVSGTWGAAGMKLYLNGQLISTDPYTGHGTEANYTFTIGAWKEQLNNTYYESFNGTIDDIGIWSRALSAQEIKSIYRFGTEAFENSISTWNSTGTTDWSSGWSATGVSTALKDAYVNSGTAVVSTAGDVAKDLYVGYTTGDSGAVSITTGDLTAANEYIGRTGTGTVTQTGGTNTIADTLYIGQNAGSTGTYNLQGGILKAHAITLGSGASTFNFTGGTLKTYSFTGDLVIGDNAVIAPGSSPGIMDVYGEFVLNGTYQAELGGLIPGTEYDQIVVHGGNITLGADSVIELAQWDSFVPEIGDSFVLMDWDEGYTFTDNGYEFDPGVYGLPGDWVLSVNGTQFEAKYVGAVPEPGCAFGLLLGFFVPGFQRLLKRRVRG